MLTPWPQIAKRRQIIKTKGSITRISVARNSVQCMNCFLQKLPQKCQMFKDSDAAHLVNCFGTYPQCAGFDMISKFFSRTFRFNM